MKAGNVALGILLRWLYINYLIDLVIDNMFSQLVYNDHHGARYHMATDRYLGYASSGNITSLSDEGEIEHFEYV